MNTYQIEYDDEVVAGPWEAYSEEEALENMTPEEYNEVIDLLGYDMEDPPPLADILNDIMDGETDLDMCMFYGTPYSEETESENELKRSREESEDEESDTKRQCVDEFSSSDVESDCSTTEVVESDEEESSNPDSAFVIFYQTNEWIDTDCYNNFGICHYNEEDIAGISSFCEDTYSRAIGFPVTKASFGKPISIDVEQCSDYKTSSILFNNNNELREKVLAPETPERFDDDISDEEGEETENNSFESFYVGVHYTGEESQASYFVLYQDWEEAVKDAKEAIEENSKHVRIFHFTPEEFHASSYCNLEYAPRTGKDCWDLFGYSESSVGPVWARYRDM